MSSPAPSPADRVSTPVDGVDVLGALSPSRAGDFMTCPLMFRFRTVDRLPEAFSVDAVRGTLVHKVLEDLFSLPAVPMILGFDPRYQFVHEDDVVHALEHAVKCDVAGVYNVAGDGSTASTCWGRSPRAGRPTS